MELGEVTEFSGESAETGTEASPYLEINEYAPLHPATRSWEVERENVTIEKVIGKGAFGQVAQGTASELRGRDGTTRVAIKMLKGNFSVRQNRPFIRGKIRRVLHKKRTVPFIRACLI